MPGIGHDFFVSIDIKYINKSKFALSTVWLLAAESTTACVFDVFGLEVGEFVVCGLDVGVT